MAMGLWGSDVNRNSSHPCLLKAKLVHQLRRPMIPQPRIAISGADLHRWAA